MASLEELKEARLAKLKLLLQKGINPYPSTVKKDYSISEVLEKFDSLAESNETVSLIGRIVALRPQGGLTFLNFNDGTENLQALLKSEEAGDERMDLFESTVDIGDFVSLSGTLFITKRGEKTLLVKDWSMVTKSLLPLPEKWHGLQDVEERFRKRYLDLIANKDVKDRFVLRSKLISEIRKHLNDHGFIEVETPILQSLPGGASALPFVTHHNALDIDLYLRIAPELFLKKLLVGGLPKVFEIGRNFRNEGIDVTHNPEFTMLEYYEAYSDSVKQMEFVESFFVHLVEKFFGSKSFEFDGEHIDFGKPFPRVKYFDLLNQAVGVSDIASLSDEDTTAVAKKNNLSLPEGVNREKVWDEIFKKICRPKLIQPTFVTDYPVDALPLAKRSKDDNAIVEAFQLYVGGLEIVKAFSELNDPIDQRERFSYQDKEKEKGDKEAQSTDEEFIEALEYGMPPAGGVGIGIDRLVMLFTNTKNIREVILFPTLRPKK